MINDTTLLASSRPVHKWVKERKIIINNDTVIFYSPRERITNEIKSEQCQKKKSLPFWSTVLKDTLLEIVGWCTAAVFYFGRVCVCLFFPTFFVPFVSTTGTKFNDKCTNQSVHTGRTYRTAEVCRQVDKMEWQRLRPRIIKLIIGYKTKGH